MRHDYREIYKNIEIRQLNENDIEYLRKWRNNPDNTTFLRKIPYITHEMQRDWFRAYLDDEEEMVFAIVENYTIHHVVGSLALYNFSNAQAEIGKILVGEPNAHGLNVCVNALSAAMKIAREKLSLHKIFLHVYKDNIPAVKVYKRAGFVVVDEHVSDNGMMEYTMSIKL